MTFLELEKQYQSHREELISTLSQLGHVCSNFVEGNPEHFEHLEYVNTPYELGYNEKYDQHWIDAKNNTITVNFSHQDPYDAICDSNSQIKYPLHWVETVFQGDEDTLVDEIKGDILQHHTRGEQQGKRDAIIQALQYCLISQEQADIFLSDIN